MNGSSSDRNLLLGIVALQMDFISRDALIKAMHEWTLAKETSLSAILVANGDLDPADRSVLESLVERHIARHGGDPEKSLSSLDSVVAARSTLDMLDDPDLQMSLGKLRVSPTRAFCSTDPEPTGTWGVKQEETGGRFRIISLHEEGGLGSVFLARDGEVNREVALKRMKDDIAADPQLRARFVFEAEITGNLEHPGIVPVYGKGEYADGRPYYAMRFIRGDTLKAAVDRFHNDPILKSDAGARHREFQKLVRRFLVVCETMAYAHSRGIIHRDIKPRNILFGPYGETLVVDWGLAKVVGHVEAAGTADLTLRPPSSSNVQATSAGSRVGTPGYMSPEQARGEIERLGPSADIYSLGATLYYMLTTRAPFIDRDVPQVLLKIERGEFPPPKDLNPTVDRALEAICLLAMKLRPENRYPSCRALADDLERWLADQPVLAYPEPFSTRIMRWVRLHRQLVASAAALLIFCLAGLLYHDRRIGLEKIRVEQARDRARDQLRMTRTELRQLLNVAGSELANFPQAEALRSKLTGHVLGSYKELLRSNPDDPGILFEMAHVHKVVAGLAHFTGNIAEAERAFIESIGILEGLVADPGQHRDATEWLAKTLIDRGDFYHLVGRTRLAAVDLRNAVIHAGSLATDRDQSVYLDIRSSALVNLSDILVVRGEPGEAYATANEAVDLLERLTKLARPEDTAGRPRWLLAIALANRGMAARDLRRRQAAIDDYRRAIDESSKIPKQAAYGSAGLLMLATSLNLLGEILLEERRDHDQAKDAFDRAIAIIEPLAKESKVFAYYGQTLAASLAGRSRLYAANDKVEQASADCDRSRSILNNLLKQAPDNPEFLSRLGDSTEIASRLCVQKGNKDQAVALLDQAVALFNRALAIDSDRPIDAGKAKLCTKKRQELAR